MMGSLSFFSFPNCSALFNTPCKSSALIFRAPAFEPQINFSIVGPQKLSFGFHSTTRLHLRSNPKSLEKDEESPQQEALVQDLRVPDNWLLPSKAVQESEWLRVVLQKWLDDEYCPEATNVEISKVAARSYYESLLQKQTDLGEILLKMARDLESISYQESFHGAFTSANASVNLIALRIEQE